MVPRNSSLKFGLFIVLTLGMGITAFCQINFSLIMNQSACCEIIIPDIPVSQEQEAAQLLKDTVKKSTNITVNIVKESLKNSNLISINVGNTSLSNQYEQLKNGLNSNGFVVHAVDANNIILVGKQPTSTYFAVTDFLEKNLGAMWIWPGEYGSELKKLSEWQIELGSYQANPAFESRIYSGVVGFDLRLNKATTNVQSATSFHHNIYKIFPPEEYAVAHPEYYPEINGTRIIPEFGSKSGWQICTSNPEVIAIAIAKAKAYFLENPQKYSFSVSPNDSAGYCRCSNCCALDFPGAPGISNRYFTFVNTVADGIKDDFPDKYIACLAYGRDGTAVPPVNLPLRGNVMVYVVIPTLGDQFAELTHWSTIASRIGVYFWMQGKPVPKIYPSALSEYLKFCLENNVKEVYTELYPDRVSDLIYGSYQLDGGARLFLTSKLFWNPNYNIGELIKQFCEGFYGSASLEMIDFYTALDIAWQRQPDQYDFGKMYRGWDLDVYSSTDLLYLQQCLTEAKLKADTEDVEQRIQLLQDEFGKMMIFQYPYALARELEISSPNSNQDYLSCLEQANTLAAMKNDSLPIFAINKVNNAISTVLGKISASLEDNQTNISQFWEDALFYYANSPLLTYLEIENFLIMGGRFEQKAINPGFERGFAGWYLWTKTGNEIELEESESYTGEKCMAISGPSHSSAGQNFVVKPGQLYKISVYGKLYNNLADSAGFLLIAWKDKNKAWYVQISNIKLDLTAPIVGDDERAWEKLETTITIPADENIGYLNVQVGTTMLSADEKVLFDDLSVVNMTPTSTTLPVLKGWWNFDEAAGFVAGDLSGNNNYGSLQNTAWINSIIGTGLAFDGINGLVDCGNDSSLKLSSTGAVTFWYKSNGWGNESTSFIARGAGAGWADQSTEAWNVFNHNSIEAITFTFGDGLGRYNWTSISPRPSIDVWHHYAFTFNGDELKAYLDGELMQSVMQTIGIINQATLNTYMGKYRTPNGILDEVKIYDQLLSADKIKDQAYCVSGRWDFEEIGGGITEDASDNINDGTLVSMPSDCLVKGKIGNALALNGVSGYVNFGDNSSLMMDTEGTIEFWYKSNGWGTESTSFVSRGDGAGWADKSTEAWNVFNHNSIESITFTLGNGLGVYNRVSISPRPSINVWHHYAFTFSGNELKAYLDGKLMKTAVQSTNVNHAILHTYVGKYRTPNGIIDELRLYRKVLTANEIDNHYKGD